MTPTTPIHNCYSPLPQCSTSTHPRLVIEPVTVAHWPIIFDLRLCDHLEGSTVSTWCFGWFHGRLSLFVFVPTLYSSITNNHLFQPLTCFPLFALSCISHASSLVWPINKQSPRLICLCAPVWLPYMFHANMKSIGNDRLVEYNKECMIWIFGSQDLPAPHVF